VPALHYFQGKRGAVPARKSVATRTTVDVKCFRILQGCAAW
jgi:hypothetical protein